MNKYSYIIIVSVPLVFICLIFLAGCPDIPSTLTSAVFTGLEKIDINPVSNSSMSTSDYFNYTLSKDIKYAIVELFSSDAEFSDNEEKKVPVDKLLAGSRTGLAGFTRDKVQASQLYGVNADRTDFKASGANYSPSSGTAYKWIVLGYDENMNLTHASTVGTVTFQ